MPTAISVQSLRKSYGSFEALRGVDLEIDRGEVFSLLGPNGAGKTTFVEVLEGYRARTAGDARVLDADPGSAGSAWKARIGIVPQSTTLFDELTVREIVTHFAGFYPAPLNPARAISMVGLDEKADARCGKLSGGQKRRVDLALGMIGDPELLFLDEPTTGLDPEGRRQLWGIVREFAALGKTVLLTTHYLDEAEALSDRVGIIDRGALVALGPPATVGGRDRERSIIRFGLRGPLATTTLPEISGELTHEGQRVVISTVHPAATLRVLLAWADECGEPELPALTVSRPSLEDVYLTLIAHDGTPGEGA